MRIVSINLPSGIQLRSRPIDESEVAEVVSELEQRDLEVTTLSFVSGEETLRLWRQLQSGQKHSAVSAVIALLGGSVWLENELDDVNTLITILVQAHQSGDRDNLPEEFLGLMQHKMQHKLQPTRDYVKALMPGS
jgi:anthranilate phosphoribosyltransferase